MNRLDEIKQRNAKVRGFNTELDADWDWLITEVARLRGQAESLHELHGQALTTIATLREEVKRLQYFSTEGE